MPNVNAGKFATPEILSRVRRDLLLTWLRPMGDYFARRGLALPGEDEQVDYDRLTQILMEPVLEMPAELLESLYVFRELDSEAAMDAIRDEGERRGLTLGPDADATPLDVVVQAWTLDRRLVQDVHHRLELRRPRSFRCFSTDARPLPCFAGPTPAQLEALETRLNAFYEAWKRGKGARVFASRNDDVWMFLVRHGAPCRREGAMKDDLPTTVFYRPQRHDVLKYDTARGEMAVNCCADRERRTLLRLFGSCLFGRPDFFPGAAKYTLAPLVEQGRGCLACGGCPGIEKVCLVEVEMEVTDEPEHRGILKANDIFRLVESGRLVSPKEVGGIKRARFQVKFARVKRPRALTIVPCNRVVYGREADSGILERLMRQRGFIEAGGQGN